MASVISKVSADRSVLLGRRAASTLKMPLPPIRPLEAIKFNSQEPESVASGRDCHCVSHMYFTHQRLPQHMSGLTQNCGLHIKTARKKFNICTASYK